MKLTKEQVNTLLKNAPQGVNKDLLLKKYLDAGYEFEGVDTAQAINYLNSKQSGFMETPKQIEEKQIQKKGYLGRVAEGFGEIGSKLTSTLQTQGDKYLEKAQKGDVVGASGELLRSGLRTVGAVAEGAFQPIIEAPGIKQAMEWVGQKLGNTEIAQKLAQKIQENPDKAQDIIDTVNILTLGGGKLVEAPLGKAISKVAPDIIEKPLVGAGKTLQSTGEKLYKVGVPMGEATKNMQLVYQASKPTLLERVGNIISGEKTKLATKPITEAETAARRGLMGSQWQLGVQSERVANKIWEKEIAPALQSFGEKIDMKQFFKDVERKIISETSDLSRKNALKEALNAVKGDFKNVKNVSLEKLQNYKADWAKLVPERVYKGKPISGALNEVRNRLAQESRMKIYDSLGDNIKQAYIDYGNLQSIKEVAKKSLDQLRTKNMGRQAWEFVLDTSIVPVSTISGQVLYRTGQGLEFIGREGAKTLRDILSGTTKAGLSIEDVSKNQPLIKESIANKAIIPKTVNTTSISTKSTTKSLKGKGGIKIKK